MLDINKVLFTSINTGTNKQKNNVLYGTHVCVCLNSDFTSGLGMVSYNINDVFSFFLSVVQIFCTQN